MPNGTQELEQRPITDNDEQTGQPSPAQGEGSSHQDGPETVQPGNVSQADTSELLGDPAAPAGEQETAPSGGQGTATSDASQTAATDEESTPPPLPPRPARPSPATRGNTAPARPSPATRGTTAIGAHRSTPPPLPPRPARLSPATQGTAAIGSHRSTPPPLPPRPARPSPATRGTAAIGTHRSTPPPLPPRPARPSSATSGTSTPASAPASDTYALLKKDVNALSEAEKQERSNLLIQKYVDDWKQKKTKEQQELTDKLSDDEKSKEETRQSVSLPGEDKYAKHDKRLEKADNIIDIAGTALSMGTDAADIAHTWTGGDDEATKNKATGHLGNLKDTVTGLWGAGYKSYSLFRGHQKHREKRSKGDSRGARMERFDMFSNLFGAASGLGNAAGGIAGFIPGGDKVSGWLSVASNAADTAGSVTDIFKGIYQRRSYKKLADRKETESSRAKMAHEAMRSRERYKEMKAAYKANAPGSHDKAKRMELLKERHAYKRSKDFMEAMEAAQETARNKSKAGGMGITKGILNALSGASSLGGSVVKQLSDSAVGKTVGAGLGILGSVMKFVSKGVEKRQEKKQEGTQKKSNAARGKKYVDEKVASFLKKPEVQADHVTDEEARLIIAKRLGVEDPNNYEDIYKKLAERRADRILNKEEGYEEVLAAMGLDKRADKATILEALGVSSD